VSEKCIGCYPKIEKGMQTQCVENCIGKIRGQGFLTDPRKGKPDPNNPIDYLVHIRKLALPLYPQFGTGPNVYYIPPIHSPVDFLEQMFGVGVQQAIDVYRNIPNDETLAGLLQLFGSSPEIMETFKVEKKIAYGYNRDGKQVAEVPITEPAQMRDGFDKERNVYRLDVT
jgi:nitrate reductase beta subunit